MVEHLQLVLKLDFLNTQLLLYRPVIFLASHWKASPEDEEHALFPKIVPVCIRKCFSCASLLISMVRDLQKSSGPLGGSPWFSLYQSKSSLDISLATFKALTMPSIAFHAALSAFAILLLTPGMLPTPIERNLFVLELAVEVLKSLGSRNKMGPACSQYIQLLLPIVRKSGERIGDQARTRTASPTRGLPTSQNILSNGELPDMEIFDVPDIDLAQFFSEDQMGFFGLDGVDNGLTHIFPVINLPRSAPQDQTKVADFIV